MSKPEPLNVYGLKDQVGWRLNDRDRQNLNVLMAAHRTTSATKLLRELVEREAEIIRHVWQERIDRRAEAERTS